jgi:hypothetical protein
MSQLPLEDMTLITDIKLFAFTLFLFAVIYSTGCMNRKPERMISKLKDVKKIEIIIDRDFSGNSFRVINEDPETIEILLKSFTLWGPGGRPIYPVERFNSNGKLIFHRKNSEKLVLDIDLLTGPEGEPGFRLERKGQMEYTYFSKVAERALIETTLELNNLNADTNRIE